MDGWTDRQMDGQIDRWMDRQTDEWTDRQMNGYINIFVDNGWTRELIKLFF